MKKDIKVAVLLYGFLRTADLTVGSLIRNVVDVNNADIFYFGPDSSDSPTQIHKGILDSSGFVKINPKGEAHEIPCGIEDKLVSIYGDKLRNYKLHYKKFDDFNEQTSFVDKNEYLFNLNPARFVSMFYNMQGAYELMNEYEEKQNFRYDVIIITRPDLSFYAPVSAKNIRHGYVYIPAGEGFCPHTGNRNIGLSQVLPYRNRSEGKMVPSGVGFNDQLLVLTGKTASCMENLLDSVLMYMREKVPLTPETLL
ncbi:TPA: hypothetical protein N6399_004700, partial [Escherichia coli]|nr:hypothetical protein [Escherichia coli]